ncbi:MAG: uroporphyrinogen decarboxylase family protein [Bacteroidota bacterium]
MTRRELVIRTIRFQGAERIPYDLPEPYGSDFYSIELDPSPDARPASGRDEWGALWVNKGGMQLGQVKEVPLASWDDFNSLAIPDVNDPSRWAAVRGVRQRAGDAFVLAKGISLYERIHFLRGLENTWADIYDETERLKSLIEILLQMNFRAIERYAAEGADGYLIPDDWGLQDTLMISPSSWRAIWKPYYARLFNAVHDAGMLMFLHSCGYIVDILDDLIGIGLDVVHMDQQENMGLELLGRRFGGRLTFFSPVDIQKTMVNGTMDDIRAYCRAMAHHLGRPEGGFIPRWYSDPAGAGHTSEALKTMCEEFLAISRSHKPVYPDRISA